MPVLVGRHKFTYSNHPPICRTQVCRLRQAGSKHTERICRVQFLPAATKQSHVEVVSIACIDLPRMPVSPYQMPDYKISKLRDIVECIGGSPISVFYLLCRSCVRDLQGTLFLRWNCPSICLPSRSCNSNTGSGILLKTFCILNISAVQFCSPPLANVSFLYDSDMLTNGKSDCRATK